MADEGAVRCRFCYDEVRTGPGDAEKQAVAPCACKGSVEYVHVACLQRWRATALLSGATGEGSAQAIARAFKCNICGEEYDRAKVPVPKQEELLRLCAGKPGAVAAALVGPGALLVAAGRMGALQLSDEVPVWLRALLKKRIEFWAGAAVLITEQQANVASDGSDAVDGLNLASALVDVADSDSDDDAPRWNLTDAVGDSPLASWRRRNGVEQNDTQERDDACGAATAPDSDELAAMQRIVYLRGGPVAPRTTCALVPFEAWRVVLATAREAHENCRRMPLQVPLERSDGNADDAIGKLRWDVGATSEDAHDEDGEDESFGDGCFEDLVDLIGRTCVDPRNPELRAFSLDRHSPFVLFNGWCGDDAANPPAPSLSDEADAASYRVAHHAIAQHRKWCPPGAFEAAVAGHEVLVFKGFCRWSYHQLLGEVARGDWGVARARLGLDAEAWHGDGLPRAHLPSPGASAGAGAMRARARRLHASLASSGRLVALLPGGAPA